MWKNIQDDVRWNLPTQTEMPLRTSHHLELDVSPELQPTDTACHTSLIGMLQWIVKLGRVDCLPGMLCAVLPSGVAQRGTPVSAVSSRCVLEEAPQC
jgi:hypothetical protein